MIGQAVDLSSLNSSELLALIRQSSGFVLRRSTTRERLMEIVRGSPPRTEEVADTTASRLRLQTFIGENINWLSSQLPCKGENRGVCTVYPCPEGRHVDCYLSAKKQLL